MFAPPPAPSPATIRLEPVLDEFFRRVAPLAAGDRVLVAFSGGPDSLALLAALVPVARARGADVVAAHLDHAADPGAAGRARSARRAAAALGVDFRSARRAARPRRGEPWEAAARRVRYRWLEEVRRAAGARWTATAHHLDDQAETVAMRLARGSGLAGLAGIRPRLGPVVRPLLGVPRAALAGFLAARPATPALAAARDPANHDPAFERTRVRYGLLPELERREPEVRERLAAVAAAALAARRAVDRRLDRALAPHRDADGTASVDAAAFASLPAPLDRWALARLHRLAGAPHPPPAVAAAELARQLAGSLEEGVSRTVGCDAGDGWRWELREERLALARRQRATGRPRPRPFSYRLRVPGSLAVPEAGVVVSVARTPVADWMFQAPPWRTALDLPVAAGDELVVRSRRPGDRLRPLGAPGRRKLKELLIDRRVPRERRDRLPIVCLPGGDGETDGTAERIAWVPGVAAEEAFRLRRRPTMAGSTAASRDRESGTGRSDAWVVEVHRR